MTYTMSFQKSKFLPESLKQEDEILTVPFSEIFDLWLQNNAGEE